MPSLGPTAAMHMFSLTEEQRELFLWFTEKLVDNPVGEAIRFSSLIQAVACEYPGITYWHAVKVVKTIAETAEFRQLVAAAEIVVCENLRKPQN